MKRTPGRPLEYPVKLLLRIDAATADRIDAFASRRDFNEDAPIGRSEAIRRILRDWLNGHKELQFEVSEDGGASP